MDASEDVAEAEGPLLGRRVQVVVPPWLGGRLPVDELSVPVRGWRGAARMVRVVVPVAAIVVGGVAAVVAAVLAEQPDTEAIGTLGTELGAAVWFAGAVLLVVGSVPTVGRVVLLVGGALAGAALVAAALVSGWEGAALALAMEFGVGAIALLVLDVVLMGIVFPRVEDLATGPGRGVVTLRLGGSSSWACEVPGDV